MKKRTKLFSSLLALGMLLGTGVGPITQIVQSGQHTTMVAKAATGEETRLENTVELTPEQITLTLNGYIESVQWDDGDQQKLLNGGTLIIPKTGSNNSNIERPIKGVYHRTFSKEKLGGEFGDGLGMKKVIFNGEEDIEYIGEKAFMDNQLTEVKLPNVKEIYLWAFAHNKLTSVTINEDYELDSNPSSVGTVNNPFIDLFAFQFQKWDDLNFDYQPTISADELFSKLNITFTVNKANDDTKKTLLLLPPEGNITLETPHELRVNSISGGTATVDLTHYTNSDSRHLNGSTKLTVNAQEKPTPGPDGNGGNNSNESGTNPDTGNGGGNNGNEAKPQPAPKPEEKRPHTVYAKRGMRLHRNVSLTSPIKSFKKQSRAKAASFRVRGIEYDKNGKKRYKVDGGYITAGSSYVADSHFRSNKVRQVRVLSNRVNSYKDVKLSSNKKVRSYKKGTKLRVKRVVNWGRATRFELTNGRYITGNKQLLIMDQK